MTGAQQGEELRIAWDVEGGNSPASGVDGSVECVRWSVLAVAIVEPADS